MKKASSPTKLKDHIGTKVYRAKRRLGTPADEFYASPSRSAPKRIVSYIPGTIPREQVDEPPPLDIRGLIGGSINLDLRGLSVRLSPNAFAHWVADESLGNLDIHRGDIAIIDCPDNMLVEGNLILLETRGKAVLRRLRRQSRIWYLDEVGGSRQKSVPIVDQPLQGYVVGILRLFTRVKAVQDGGKLRQSDPSKLQPIKAAIPKPDRRRIEPLSSAPPHSRAAAKRKSVILAAEAASSYSPAQRRAKSRSTKS